MRIKYFKSQKLAPLIICYRNFVALRAPFRKFIEINEFLFSFASLLDVEVYGLADSLYADGTIEVDAVEPVHHAVGPRAVDALL